MELFQWHKTLLADGFGQKRFREALRSVIREGDVVLDVGTGTGIHALFACQAGARRVYAVEHGAIIEVAKQVCAANGSSDRVCFIRASALEVELPEQVDVLVIHEDVHTCLQLIPSLRDRALKPGASVVPRSVDVVCAPLQSPEAFEDVTFWDYDHYGFSFSPCRAKAPHEPVEHRIASHELLGRATRLASLDFATVRTPKVTATAEVPIERNGLLHGFGLWYVHWLTERISVSSGPQCELHPSVWPSFFLPMQAPTAVTEGDTATMTFQTTPRAWRDIWSWRGTIRNAQGVKASFNQSTFFALPLSKDLVHKSAAERKPTLNPRGEAARLILEMCKEARPLGIIEDEVAGAFPKLFRDRATAASFVAKTLEPYSQ